MRRHALEGVLPLDLVFAGFRAITCRQKVQFVSRETDADLPVLPWPLIEVLTFAKCNSIGIE